MDLALIAEKGRAFARFAGEVAAETLWPTRCALCDAPGSVLCERCERSLPYVDRWSCCSRCGAPFGLVQCSECNPVTLGRLGRTSLPFAAGACTVLFDDSTGRIVRIFKDRGEQRLSEVIAACKARALPLDWPFDALTFVPASRTAIARRGFDHALLLAEALAALLNAPCMRTLDTSQTADQRALGRAERLENLTGSFSAEHATCAGKRFVLVDDVHTTGATLCAATDALIASGAREVRVLTFARVL